MHAYVILTSLFNSLHYSLIFYTLLFIFKKRARSNFITIIELDTKVPIMNQQTERESEK